MKARLLTRISRDDMELSVTRPVLLPIWSTLYRQILVLVDALSEAIRKRESKQLMDPMKKHKAVSNMYYWPEVRLRLYQLRKRT